MYDQFPAELKNAISNTRVVSGYACIGFEPRYGSCDSYDNNRNNYVTEDKLYILDAKEIYNRGGSYDSSSSKTFQLDYYKNNNITSDYTGELTIKKYESIENTYWLRYVNSSTNVGFSYVKNDGGTATNYYTGDFICGVAPAFRIG